MSKKLVPLFLITLWCCKSVSGSYNNAQLASEETGAIVAIYSGSFDPPHLGHRAVALAALRASHAKVIYVIPNLSNPSKPKMLPYTIRKEMTGIIFRNDEHVRLPDSDIERSFDREDIHPLLTALRQHYPNASFVSILGDDVFERPNLTLTDEQGLNYLVAYRNGLSSLPHLAFSKISMIETEGFEDCASGKIRKALASHEPLDPQCMDSGVFDYIKQNNLYQ